MTLNITAATNWGIWQCSDNRLGKPEDKTLSVKQLSMQLKDSTAILVYSGIGAVPVQREYIHISDWLREILRGENRTLDETIKWIVDQSNLSLKGIKKDANEIQHTFTIAALENNKPRVIRIQNYNIETRKICNFYQVYNIVKKKPILFCSGSGSYEINPKEIKSKIRKKPIKPEDYFDLFGQLNQQISEKQPDYVSPSCIISYVIVGKKTIHSYFYSPKDHNAKSLTIPCIVNGFDATEITKHIEDDLCQLIGETPREKKYQSKVSWKQAHELSVKPRNRIK